MIVIKYSEINKFVNIYRQYCYSHMKCPLLITRELALIGGSYNTIWNIEIWRMVDGIQQSRDGENDEDTRNNY